MKLVDQISITSSKLYNLINATDTYKDRINVFGRGANNNYVIIDVLNFGFLSFFPNILQLF